MLVSRPTVLEHMPLESLQHENVLSDILLRATLIHHKDVLSPVHLRDEVYAEFHHFDKVAGVKVYLYLSYCRVSTLLYFPKNFYILTTLLYFPIIDLNSYKFLYFYKNYNG